MTQEEQLSFIIEKKREKELFSFLQSQEPAERKKLGPILKKLGKHYNDYKPNLLGQYSHVGTEEQRDMVLLAGFVCSSMKDFEKDFYSTWILDPVKLNKVKNWYCPPWFSDFVNKQASQDYVSHWITYEWVLQLTDEGLVNPSRMLIAKILPDFLYENGSKNNSNRWSCKPEKLHRYPQTLSEHIWYIFEEETSIHYSGRYMQFENGEHKHLNAWVSVLCNLSADGNLDRSRLLKEALQATNKNFNKVLSGWFVDLFTELKPSLEELLTLQKELQTVLNSPHSKAVGMSLQYLKKLSAEKSFDAEGLLDAAPVVLAGVTKSNTASCLMLLEQIGRKRKELHSTIANLCCQVFIHSNDELQTRAAKIIEKFGDKEDDMLTTNLQQYKTALLQNANKLLTGFFNEEKNIPEETATPANTVNTIMDEDVPLPSMETTDDLLFLASQAFDNNESWHIDLLPAALVNLMPQLIGPVLAQLQPALQSALKLTKNELRSTQGNYDHMLAIFFIDVCVYLVRQHQADAAALNKVFEDFNQKGEKEIRKWMNIDYGSSYISNWTNHQKDPFYLPYKQLLTGALNKIRNNDTLPLLSTPTHRPAWISPEKLVDRIYQYQQKNVLAEAIDAQLALSRCRLKDTTAALQLVKEKTDGEWKRLLIFLLDNGASPEGPFTQPDAWMLASLSKWPKQQYPALNDLGYYEQPFEKYTGQFSWQAIVEEYEKDSYDYSGGSFKTIKAKATRKQLKINRPKLVNKEQTEGLKGWLQKLKPKPRKVLPLPIFYDHLQMKAEWLSVEHNDIRRALLMLPNNPEAFLPAVVQKCMQHPEYIGETDKKMTIAVLQTMHEIWFEFGEMGHLFLAVAMLSVDKTVAGMAAEIWLRYAPEEKINTALLGHIIGLNERIEFAPLKRFTDLIMQQLFRISAQHNRLLQILVEHILQELPDAPIKNLKKLLEIYAELIAANNTTASALLQPRFQIWNNTTGLKKVMEGLLE